MKKEQFSRFYNMETRWYDEDMLGHLNHGTAVTYFEDARVRHANDIGLFPYDSNKFPFIVASMSFAVSSIALRSSWQAPAHATSCAMVSSFASTAALDDAAADAVAPVLATTSGSFATILTT